MLTVVILELLFDILVAVVCTTSGLLQRNHGLFVVGTGHRGHIIIIIVTTIIADTDTAVLIWAADCTIHFP